MLDVKVHEVNSMPHPIDIHVGQRLRLRRTMVGMSQKELGASVDLTFQQIQKYERGANRIGSSRLHDFARILSVPVSYFFEGMEGKAQPADIKSAGAKSADMLFATPPSSASFGFAAADGPPGFEHEPLSNRETLEMMRAYYRITDPKLRRHLLDLARTLSGHVDSENTEGAALRKTRKKPSAST